MKNGSGTNAKARRTLPLEGGGKITFDSTLYGKEEVLQ
jgi:hypothetical protein